MKRQQAVFSIRTSPRGRTVRRSSTNHIVHVTDSVTSGHSYAGAFHFADGANTDTEYEYDDNGNMTKDLNRGITGITYNALNLPSVVSFTDNSYIEYTYGADGQKLRTQYGVQPGLGPLTPADAGGSILAGGTAVTDAVETVPSTDELSRVDYCGNMVYDRGERRLLLENGFVTFDLQTGLPDSPYATSMTNLFYFGYNDKDYKTAVNNFFSGSLGGDIYKEKLGYKIGTIKENPLKKFFLPVY